MDEIITAIQTDERASIKKAFKNYKDIKNMQIDEKSLLSYAIFKNISLDNFILLVELGADINAKTSDGVNLLDEAISMNRLDLAKYLIEEKNFDANIPTRKSGFTPLMLAASFSYFEIVDFLIEKGADINAKDPLGLTSLDYARKLGQTAMQRHLQEKLK